MAQHTIVQLTDDLDGTEIKNGSGETVNFELDGVSYQIDLAQKNAKKLRETLQPYVSSARRGSKAASHRGRAAHGSAKSVDTQAVREWAKQSGYEISDRGRISAAVMSAYHDAKP